MADRRGNEVTNSPVLSPKTRLRVESAIAHNARHSPFPLSRNARNVRNAIYKHVLSSHLQGGFLIHLPNKDRDRLPTKLPLVCHCFHDESQDLYQATNCRFFRTHRLVVHFDEFLTDSSSNDLFLLMFKQFQKERILVRRLNLAFTFNKGAKNKFTVAVTLSVTGEGGEALVLDVRDQKGRHVQGSSDPSDLYYPFAVDRLQLSTPMMVVTVPGMPPRIDVGACVKAISTAYAIGGMDAMQLTVPPLVYDGGLPRRRN